MIKNYLRTVCDWEGSLHQSELALQDAKARLSKEENNAKMQKKQHESEIAKKKEIQNTEQGKVNRINSKLREDKKKGILTFYIIAIVLTIIAGVFLSWYFSSYYDYVLPAMEATMVMFNIYSVLAVIAIILFFLFEEISFSKVFKFCLTLGIMALLTHKFFELCNTYLNMNSSDAVIPLMWLVIIGEITFAINAYSNDDNNIERLKQNLRIITANISKINAEIQVCYDQMAKDAQASKMRVYTIEREIQSKQNDILYKRQKVRELYAKNILHPKYQNWVAASTMYEYLDTGRCKDLTGAHGAYNIYEQELLAKKILDSIAALKSEIWSYRSDVSDSQTYIKKQLKEIYGRLDKLESNEDSDKEKK